MKPSTTLNVGAGAASRNSTLTSGFVTENHDLLGEEDDDEGEEPTPQDQEEAEEENDGEDDLFKLPDQFHEAEMETVLQQLMGDAELHKMLAQEKMRCETHKTNYSKLKGEYLRYLLSWAIQGWTFYFVINYSSRLFHDNQVLSSQLNQLEADRLGTHEASNKLNEQAQQSIQKLSKEIEELQVRPYEQYLVSQFTILAVNGGEWVMNLANCTTEDTT